jgi:hypothetical protein
MKVSDLMTSDQKDFALLAGKQLAKMYRKFGVPTSFKHFYESETLVELENVQELQQVHQRIFDICQQNELGIQTVNFSQHFQEYVLPGGREGKVKAQTIEFIFNRFVTTQKSKMLEYIKMDKDQPTRNGIEVVIKCDRLNTIETIAIKKGGTHIEFVSIITKGAAAFKSDARPWTKTVYV